MISHVYQSDLDAIACYAIEYKSCRVRLVADSKVMDLDLRFICCKCRRNLQHMGSQLELAARGQVICVVLNEAGCPFSALRHLHKDSAERTDLIITFRTKAYAFVHEILNRNTRKLIHTEQILERVSERANTILSHEYLECDLVSCLLTNRRDVVRRHCVLRCVLFHLGIDLSLCKFGGKLGDFSDTPVLNLPAVLDLALKAVAVCYGDIPHIIAKCSDRQIA